MSHPRRREAALGLMARAPEGFLRLVLDPEPDGPPTALRTAISAWAAADPAATHHLVLQDDAQPCEGFFDRVQDAVRGAPHAAVAFFTSWNSRNGAAVRMGALLGARWAGATQEYTPTVALALPTPVALGFADFARRHGAGWPDDVVMQRYLRARRVPTYLTVPNLVEHDDFRSVARNDQHGLRRAACPGTVPPGADWDLATGLSQAGVVPFFKHGVAQCAVRGGNGPGDGTWTIVDSDRYCGRLGFPLEWFRKKLTETVEAAPAPGALSAIRPRALEALWTTAGLTGFLGRTGDDGHDPGGGRQDGDGADGNGPDGPGQGGGRYGAVPDLWEAAVGTMGPGGLCGELGAAQLSALRRDLAELAGRGVRLGAAARAEQAASARRTGSVPKRRAGRVTVVGSFHGLARFLAHDLGLQDFDTVLRDTPAGRLTARDLAGADAVVHVGPLAEGGAVRAAAGRAGTGHVVSVATGLAGHADPPATTVPSTPNTPNTPGTPGDPAAARAVLTVLRVGTPYGPGVAPDGSLLADFVARALLRRPIRLTAPLPDPVRYVHATDVCRAVERALLLRRPGTFDICNDEALGARDLADAVCAAVREVPVETPQPPAASARSSPVPAGPAGRTVPAAERAAAELGWRPVVPLAEGLRSFAQWLAYEAD